MFSEDEKLNSIYCGVDFHSICYFIHEQQGESGKDFHQSPQFYKLTFSLCTCMQRLLVLVSYSATDKAREKVYFDKYPEAIIDLTVAIKEKLSLPNDSVFEILNDSNGRQNAEIVKLEEL